jgi:pantoate--beta-alanine ligase
MIIFKKIFQLQNYLFKYVEEPESIGFVPTMGALHQGHISLVKQAKKANKFTVVSIFVNPTQFNDKTDFEKYPISIEEDMAMLIDANCDILFLPAVTEMYPDGTDAMPSFDFGYLDTILEGAQRPGHFKGVGQVVSRLLSIVNPDKLYLGQKDYQQCMAITKLVQLMDKQNDIEIIISPTIREQDGLAMSSRNRRLTEPQRALAGLIYQCLVSIQAKQTTAPFSLVQKECADLLREKGFEPEYIALADAKDLTLLNEFDPNRKMIALIATKLGGVRLIDNMLLT